jgi:hypothetical protein
MWYWIKSPNGQENDYNFEELKRALREGKVRPDWMARRHTEQQWFPVQHFLEHDAENGEDGEDGEAQHGQPPAKNVVLSCGKCGQSLRLPLPLQETTYPCPSCQTVYKATKVSDAPITYVLMPLER